MKIKTNMFNKKAIFYSIIILNDKFNIIKINILNLSFTILLIS